ncbi:type VII secretion-associated protein, partial [Rhodococcus aerolatus]
LAPAPARRRRPRVLGAAALLVVVAAGGTALALRGGGAPEAPPTRTVTVGDAAVAVPASWSEARRTDAPGTATGDTASVVLSPDGTESAANRLLVQQTVLAEGADAAAVLDTLRTSVADASTGTDRYSTPEGGVTYAGRTVTRYTETLAGAAVVDWSVVVEGRSQISVGCQHDAADPGAVAAACEAAVASARRASGS